MVVHAVTGGGDSRLEAEAVVGHARQESRCALASPAILAHRNLQLRLAHGQVIFHEAGIHLLLGDRIAAYRQAISLPQKRPVRLGSFERFELVQTDVVRLLGKRRGQGEDAGNESKEKKSLWAHSFV